MSDLLAARMQMAFTLGFHIVLAALGVGMPLLMLIAEARGMRLGDPLWRTLARRWSRSFAVLFAVGSVSGTVLSFELGLLWPGLMGRFGAVIGLPFTLEGFAFFLEAIFVGVYLYGWDHLGPVGHWLAGVPIALSGVASAWFVVTANAWMNVPRGFRLSDGGAIIGVDPLAAMLNPAAGAQTTHMIVAAFALTGFVIAAFYAVSLLRHGESLYARRAMNTALLVAIPAALAQPAVGHWSARVVAHTQPVKLAAMEGQFSTEREAPLRIGGVPDEQAGITRYAVEIPGGLSWLAYGDRQAEVRGLNDFPHRDTPPVALVHFPFQVMVMSGMLLWVVALWAAWRLWRSRPAADDRWFLKAVALCGPVAVISVEAGWMVTEIGRQPWVVHGYLRTADCVTASPGVRYVLVATVAIYLVLAAGATFVLRALAKTPLAEVIHAH